MNEKWLSPDDVNNGLKGIPLILFVDSDYGKFLAVGEWNGDNFVIECPCIFEYPANYYEGDWNVLKWCVVPNVGDFLADL